MIPVFALAIFTTPTFLFMLFRVREFFLSGHVRIKGFDCLRRESPAEYWTGMGFALFGTLFVGSLSILTVWLSAAHIFGFLDAPN
jgi:hypothetical protein